MPKYYTVCIPIAGHAYIEVEAENRDDALEKAMNDCAIEHIEEWEALEKFNSGNVCHCPTPWRIEIIDEQETD